MYSRFFLASIKAYGVFEKRFLVMGTTVELIPEFGIYEAQLQEKMALFMR